MAISAYSSGVNTLSSYSIDVRQGVQQGDMLYWDATQNLFYTDRGIVQKTKLSEFTNDVPFATQSWVEGRIANVNSGGGVDLSLYATISYVNSLVSGQDHFDGQYSNLTGAPNLHIVATSGDYNDLINKPNLFSGDYNDLINKPTIPNLTGYATQSYVNQSISSLRLTNLNIQDGTAGQVLTTDGAGNFSFTTISQASGSGIDLTDLSVTTNTGAGGGSLSYDNTTGIFTFAPADLSQFVTQTNITSQINAAIATVPSNTYVTTTVNNAVKNIQLGDLTDVSPTTPQVGYVLKWNGTTWFAAPDATGSGGSGIALTNLSVTQTAPSGTGSLSYNNVTGVFTYTPPASTGGVTSYTQLTNLPDLTIYQTIANAFDGDYNSLTNTPTIPTDVSDLTDTTNLLGSGGVTSYTQLTDLPDLTIYQTVASAFDGDYNSLTNTPTIPSLTGYATETYVNNAISQVSSFRDRKSVV